MNPDALTTADLLSMLQAGSCVDARDGMSLTSATEPLRAELLELRALRAWKAAVRKAGSGGETGFAALDRANSEAFDKVILEVEVKGG